LGSTDAFLANALEARRTFVPSLHEHPARGSNPCDDRTVARSRAARHVRSGSAFAALCGTTLRDEAFLRKQRATMTRSMKELMRLSEFILEKLEDILQEWEDFASTLAPDALKPNRTMLRDHAKKMLQTIAADLARPQTPQQKDQKSKGHAASPSMKETAADAHGAERLASGFSLDAALAEYRALRASVIRRWQAAFIDKPVPGLAIDDIIRFNEAIDQAISESVSSYSFEKDQQTRVFDTILSSSPDLTFTFDLGVRFQYANKALTEVLELPLDRILGSDCSDLNLPNEVEMRRQIEHVITSKQQLRAETPYTSPSGRWGVYDYIIVPVLNEEGAVDAIAVTARNVTDRKAVEETNWRKANYDLVTGLPNRRLFRDRLDQNVKHADRNGSSIALLFIDLDRFKETNDTFGHDAGDVLLRLAADRIRACARETDTVARFGGDEFTVILKDIRSPEHVERVAEKILKALASPFEVSSQAVSISASIGITLSPQDADAAEPLIRNADRAMYEAKSAGSNRFRFFSSDLHTADR
jgi:diguanylate cyclase (GGDEF)-like protein/PAS domain S-box-containing protein